MGEKMGDKSVNNLSDVEQKLRGILQDLEVLSLEKALHNAPGKTFMGSDYNKLNNKKASREQIRKAIANKFSKKYPLA